MLAPQLLKQRGAFGGAHLDDFGDQSEDLIRDRRLALTRSGQDPSKASNLLKMKRMSHISRILCAVQMTKSLARRGDHSSRSRFAP
jgi:hypothetical protein